MYAPLAGVLALALTFGGFITGHTTWAAGVTLKIEALEADASQRLPLDTVIIQTEQALKDLKESVARIEASQRRVERELLPGR